MNKVIKSELWEVWHKLKEIGASRKVTDAVIDIMVVMEKEEKKND